MAVGDLTSLTNVQAWLTTTSDPGNVLARLITQVSAAILGELQRPSLISSPYTDLSDGFDHTAEYLDNWPVTAVSQVSCGAQIIPPAPLQIGSNISSQYGYRLQPWDGYSPGGPQAVELVGGRFWRGHLNVSIAYTAGYLTSETWTVPSGGGAINTTQTMGPWAADSGVAYAAGGVLTKVPTGPTVGEYSVNPSNGSYSFAAADGGQAVTISYSYVPSAIEDACINWVSERYQYRQRIGLRSKSLGGQETMSYDLSAIPKYIDLALQPYRKILPI